MVGISPIPPGVDRAERAPARVLARSRAVRAAVVAAALVIISTCGLARSAAAGRTLSAPAIGSCAVTAPSTAAGWQTAFDDLNTRAWSGGDQTASVRLPDGRLLWIFGDTFQGRVNRDGSRALGTRLVHNSLVIADQGCLRPVTGLDGREVIPNAPDGQFYWPQQAFFADHTLYLTVLRVAKTTTGALGFTTTGAYLARFHYVPGGTPTFAALYETPASNTPDTTPQWGTAVAQADGYTYFYGTQHVSGVLGDALYVARVPTGSVTCPAAWRFWTGSAWAAVRDRARPIKDAIGGVSTSLSIWHRPDGTWCGLTKKNGLYGSVIVLLSARAPTGPETETVVGRSPSFVQPGEFTYNSLAHPEIPVVGGGLLVSTNRNNTSLARLMANAELYKPRFTNAPQCPSPTSSVPVRPSTRSTGRGLAG